MASQRVSPEAPAHKAILLLSGGADSTLAMRMMLDQGIELLALNFRTCFCTCSRDGCGAGLRETCGGLGVPLRSIFLGDDYLRMIAEPRFGYGKGMNPCIDCRILILRRAREAMLAEGASFVVTGEVVGQRPMSQQMQQLKIIERESGLRGRLLRPLSAKLLPPTYPELAGTVDRSGLLAIQGRSRRQQIELADKLGFDEIPCSSGGCLLTIPRYAEKVRDLYSHADGGVPGLNDAKLLRVGRHFRFAPEFKVVVGRNHSDNLALGALALQDDLVFSPPEEINGPVVLARGRVPASQWPRIAALLLRYADIDTGERADVTVRRDADGLLDTVTAEAMPTDEPPRYLL